MNSDRRKTVRQSTVRTGLLLVCLMFAAPGIRADDAMLPTVSEGFELPVGIQLYRPRGTGQTTGHIATLTIENNTDTPFELSPAMFYIPMGNSGIQGYVGRPVPGHAIPPGATADVPIEGYCSTIRLPPAPDGADLPPPEEWIVSTGETGPVTIAPSETAGPPGNALVPGTDTPLPRAISQDDEPLVAAPLLFAAITEIERVTVELQESGDFVTPFSPNPEREREAVIQQVFWIFAAELENDPYTKEQFAERLEAQFEANTGLAIAEAPEEDRERVQQGADDFWGAFTLVGAEAKVINVEGAAAGAETETSEESDGASELVGAKTEVVEPPCTLIEKIDHSPPMVQVIIADSYGDDESRAKISAGIRQAVESKRSTYAADTPPSTAYAIWRRDHIGGISSGYADTVFLEQNGQDWVWSTDPMATSASGKGVHTLGFEPGPECSAVVAGAASMWIKASSEAFDPLERSIEHFRALDAVKELSVKYVGSKLPPGLDDALEAGVEAITDPSSDTYASATGKATLTVGSKVSSDTAENRVTYKREDKEDKAIVGGGETIRKFSASDQKPNSLTSRIEANSRLGAGAEGNGFAKASLESVYGTILIGVCECPSGTMSRVLTDNGQLIQSEGAQAAAERAIEEMNEAAERIVNDIKSGEQATDGNSLKARAEGELGAWAKSIGGDRFEEQEADEEGQPEG